MTQDDYYTLATGELGVYRLRILHKIHQPYTESLFQRIRITKGMQVADIGCGIGSVSTWFAQQVGASGSVVGIDVSAAQLEQARQHVTALGLSNLSFVQGSAYDTGLPHDSFDVAYCRFLLMHLTRPAEALREMLAIVKPGGLLVCEEADFSTAFCDPPSPVHTRCYQLFLSLSNWRNQHFCLGSTLYRIFKDVGLAAPEVSLVQPVVVRGENKHLMDLSLFEATNAFVEAGLATQEEIDFTVKQMKILAADESTLFGIARVTQVWAQKSA